MYSGRGNAALPALGFPIRESTGQRLFSASPWLIAAVHALHRLLVPRHPPCALLILTVIWTSEDAQKELMAEAKSSVIPVLLAELCSFQGPCKRRRRDSPSVSQNSTACGRDPPYGARGASRLGRHC